MENTRNQNQTGVAAENHPHRTPSAKQDAYERAKRRRAAEIRKQKEAKKKRLIRAAIAAAVVAVLVVVILAIIGSTKLDRMKVEAENTENGIKLSWSKIEGAENYEISKETSEGRKVIKLTPKTSYVDKKPVNGDMCSYRFRAVSSNNNGKVSKLKICRLAPVEITDATVDENSVTLTWKGFDTAKHYEIYKRVGDGELSKIETVSANTLSYTDKDIDQDSLYNYAVKQVTSHGESPIPKEKSVPTMSTKLESASVRNSPSGVKVSWKGNFDFASGYNIYRKVKDGKWTLAGTANADASEFIDKDAKFGKTISYKVCMKLGEKGEGEATKAGSVYALDPNKKLVALTYDDGPYTPVTNVILDTMEKYDCHCTFFVVGDRVENFKECLSRATSLGCEIGSHTYNHKYLSTLSGDSLNYQLDEAKKVIEKYSGTKCTILRPPGGYMNSNVPYPSIMWSVDTMDWSNRNAATTLANAKNNIFDGCIVLMHDLYESSAQATVSLVPYLIDKGYQLVTVSEMMDLRGIKMQNGVSYYQAEKK